MSYLALYRKYRPTNFSEVVGQEYIKKVLKNSIENGTVSHAYLFSGPRGTGKTTIAKLVAKLINCDDKKGLYACDSCSSCLSYNEKNNPDIIEIDAASNNGVDEIREIKDKVNLMPSISKYKVYIIDEVHMLSIGAFNALLKTLEEPPSHVIFILATTEFFKVPETIVSRCQCFDFERISEHHIIEKLTEIVDKENLSMESEVLPLIAKYSAGGLRDAINMLDKLVCCTNQVTVEDFYELKGLTTTDDLKTIYECLIKNDVKKLFDTIDKLENKGKNLVLLAEELMIYFKDLLLEKIKQSIDISSSDNLYISIEILSETILNMKKSDYPKIILEVNLLKIIEKTMKKITNNYENENKEIPLTEKNSDNIEEIKQKEADTSEQLVTPVNLIKEKTIYIEDGKIKFEESKEIEKKISKLSEILEKNRKIRIHNTFATANKSILEDLKIRWINISEYLNDIEYSNIVTYLIDGTLKVAGEDNLIISVAYSSVLENALVNIEKIEYLLELVMKHNYKIAFILDSEWENLKNRYISDKKAGIEYKIEEEIPISCDIINEELSNKEKSDIVKEAEDLFGNDLVEVK